VRRIAHADADLDPAATDVVEHRQVFGEPHRMVERQQAYVARKAHVSGARRHRRGDRDPRREIAVIDEVMLREPDEIEPKPVQPCHLVKDGGIEVLVAHAGFGWIAEVVSDAQAQCLCH
jgi:hypothetical protein